MGLFTNYVISLETARHARDRLHRNRSRSVTEIAPRLDTVTPSYMPEELRPRLAAPDATADTSRAPSGQFEVHTFVVTVTAHAARQARDLEFEMRQIIADAPGVALVECNWAPDPDTVYDFTPAARRRRRPVIVHDLNEDERSAALLDRGQERE